MLWIRMAFMLTCSPSMATKSPMCQAAVLGIGRAQHASLHDGKIFSAGD